MCLTRSDQHLQPSRGWGLLQRRRMRINRKLHPALVPPQVHLRRRPDRCSGLRRVVRPDHLDREPGGSLQAFEKVPADGSTHQSVKHPQPVASRRFQRRRPDVAVDRVQNAQEGRAVAFGRKSRRQPDQAGNF